MTALTLELPPEIYQRLRVEAERRGKPAETVARDVLAEHLAPAPLSERDRAREVLRAAGLLAEPSEEMKRIAAQSTLTLEEARQILDSTEGKPLSEIILEMRGPKE
jgi:plasmid stability protein